MAKFPKMTMTKQGLDMLIKSGSGKPEDKLIIVGARLGDGNFDGNIRELTDLVSPKLDVTLADYKELGNGKAEITCTFTNENIDVGFYHREVGILAKNGEDGIVKLLNYSNAGNYTSYLPDKTEAIPIQTLKLGVAIGDTVNVDGHIDFSTAVTVEMLNTAIDAHNKDETAHPGMIEKHNKDANAHSGFFVPILGAIMKGILYLVDPADDSNDTQAATTGWTRRMFSSLMQKAFDLAGVQYNLNQNGFVKFGSFFGGLCIQWGIISSSASPYYLSWPTIFTPLSVAGNDYNENDGLVLNFYSLTQSGCMASGNRNTLTNQRNVYCRWIAVGHA